MNRDILGICNAYESGYGHGYDQRNLGNPYSKLSDEWEAYDYGYNEGNRKKMDNDSEVLPDGFSYATTGELALELGSQPDEAKAVETRIEPLTGNTPRLVD